MHAHINRKSKNYSNTFKVDFMKCLGKKMSFWPHMSKSPTGNDAVGPLIMNVPLSRGQTPGW